MTWNKKVLVAALVMMALTSSGCRQASVEDTPTPQPDMILTAAAQTAEVRLTEIAQPTATMPPTQAATLPPVTLVPQITETVVLEVTPAGTVASTSVGGDRADFFADISVPDGTNFTPGEAFTKVWRLRNGGTTTWTTDYALAFIGGAQMGGPNAVPLANSVPPGETVDISVNLVAPETTGNYRGYWEMRNAAGELFATAVYVEINVTGGTPAAGPTSAPSGEARASDISISVDDASPTDCPNTFTFTATFNLNKPATVPYVLEAGTDTPGFEFDLPGPFTSDFSAGSHAVSYNLDISDSVEGWAQLHVTAPNDVTSNQATFSLDCSP